METILSVILSTSMMCVQITKDKQCKADIRECRKMVKTVDEAIACTSSVLEYWTWKAGQNEQD